MNLYEICGWIGYMTGPLTCIALVVDTYKCKSHTNYTVLVIWFFGELLALIYILGTTKNPPIIANTIISSNLVLLVIILQLRNCKERKEKRFYKKLTKQD